jgi:hypothetical protein
MNRQALGPLIVGTISVGSGLWVGLQLRIDRCLDKGGRWDPVLRMCGLPPDTAPITVQQTMTDFAIGGVVMVVFGFMLMRLWAAVEKKNQRRAGAAGVPPLPPRR